MERLFFSLLLSIVVSCKNDNSIENQLKLCINESLNKTEFGDEIIQRDPKIEYYKIMSELEQVYLDKGFLKNISKESYKDFFEEGIIEPAKIEAIKLLDSYDFPLSTYPYTNKIFTVCPEKISITNAVEIDSDIVAQIKGYNKIYANGYEDNSVFIEFIDNTKNFDNIIYRAPIILLTAMYLNYTFTPNPRKK